MKTIQKQPHGSESLSRPDSSRRATLTNGASSMSGQMTLPGIVSATSLQASEAGPTHCDLPGGQTTSPRGQEAAHASHSVAPALGSENQTRATFGQFGSSSSESAVLQSSLANRLQARLPYPGLMEYSAIWKVRTTPAGRRISALRASGRRTSGSDCIGWPTTQAHDAQGSPGSGCAQRGGAPLGSEPHGWPTAKASNSHGPRNAESILKKYDTQGRSTAHRLDEAAALT